MRKLSSLRARASAPSQRQLRVSETVRRALVEVFTQGEIGNPLLTLSRLTISEVRVSPDCRNGTIFFLPFGETDPEALLRALETERKAIRFALSKRLRMMKYIPDLRFVFDSSFDEAIRMTSLLKKLGVAEER